MKSIADALVYAVTFINCREADDDELDDDVGALESIAAFLSNATPEECDVLATAAKRALAAELSSASPRETFTDDLSTWMEDMFGDEWNGNDRV